MKREVVVFTDDLDESPASETVFFGLDGTQFEIDLNSQNARALRDVLAIYVASGRRRTNARRTESRFGTPRPARIDAEQLSAIRRWARAEGIPVSARGRIPHSVRDAFQEAHQVPTIPQAS